MRNKLKRPLYVAVILTLFGPTELRADAPEGRYEIVDDTVRDLQTGLTWQRSLDPASYDRGAAETYCQSLGAGWRLPVFKELLTLIDVKRTDPSVDLTAFPATPSAYFWTASRVVASASNGRCVNFFDGSTGDNFPLIFAYRVRCVR